MYVSKIEKKNLTGTLTHISKNFLRDHARYHWKSKHKKACLTPVLVCLALLFSLLTTTQIKLWEEKSPKFKGNISQPIISAYCFKFCSPNSRSQHYSGIISGLREKKNTSIIPVNLISVIKGVFSGCICIYL